MLGRLGVAENTEREHNIVVCTLCSCYPHDLLGDPPWWYRTDEYKRRITEDPRAPFPNPLDHPESYPPLYTVRFGFQELTGRPSHDSVTADLHEDWLEPAQPNR